MPEYDNNKSNIVRILRTRTWVLLQFNQVQLRLRCDRRTESRHYNIRYKRSLLAPLKIFSRSGGSDRRSPCVNCGNFLYWISTLQVGGHTLTLPPASPASLCPLVGVLSSGSEHQLLSCSTTDQDWGPRTASQWGNTSWACANSFPTRKTLFALHYFLYLKTF